MKSTESIRLHRLAGGWHLIERGRSSLILGGELHNSSTGGKRFLEGALRRAVDAGVDTVLAAVTWEQIEVAPGRFDLQVVDDLIAAVENFDLRLIPLWFGAWKNGRSSYVPSWILDDQESFPHAACSDDHPMPTLSLFGGRLLEAERVALARVVERLSSVSASGTVVALQLNNEVGLLGGSRDRSDAANRAFREAIPPALAEALNVPSADVGADWETALGSGASTDEMFMAWHYATHTEQLARDVKTVLPVPLFVNAWLNERVVLPGVPAGGVDPGDYPSGGPLAHVANAWRLGAPSVEILAPDIYFGDDEAIMCRFTQEDAPLFIPETELGHIGAGRAFLSIGRFGGLGIAPFGIDCAGHDEADALRWAYERIRAVTPEILEARSRDAVTGFVVDGRLNSPWFHKGVRYEVWGTPSSLEEPVASAYGLLLLLPGGEILAVGCGFTVRAFGESSGRAYYVRDVYEDEIVEGERRPLRRLNGDETGAGFGLTLPLLQSPPTTSPISVDSRSTGVRRGRFVDPGAKS